MKIASGTVWLATATLQLTGRLPTTDGHGFLTAPKVEFFTQHEDPTAYSATIDGPKALPVPDGMHYGWGPALSTEAFTAAFGNSSYKTLREFVMMHQTMQPSAKIDPECGRTNVGAKALQPLPDQVVWQHGDHEGFTLSHEGPCEVWCDDELVFVEKNCAKKYPHIPAKLPYDRSKCQDKSRLQIVWLALHDGTRWQVYMNCAPLAGAGGSTPKKGTPSSTSNDSESARSSTPSVLPGTVKPSAALDDGKEQLSTAPASSKRPSPSVTPTPSKTHSASKSPKSATVPKTKSPVDQASPVEGPESDGDDAHGTDDLDCDPSASTDSSREGRAISIPRWLTNPLQLLTAHQTVDASAKNLRSLEEVPSASSAPRSHDHSSGTLSSDSSDSASQSEETVASTATQNETVPSSPVPTQLKPSPAPTTHRWIHHLRPVLPPGPVTTFKPPRPSTPCVSMSRMPRPHDTEGSRVDGSSSGSDDNSSSDEVGCATKKLFMIGDRLQNPHFPAIPPGGVHTRKPLLTLATYNNRDGRKSRKLEAAPSAPVPTASQQVIHWENGVQEAIAPHIAEKAKADFEAVEKKRDEYRDKIKKIFGYV